MRRTFAVILSVGSLAACSPPQQDPPGGGDSADDPGGDALADVENTTLVVDLATRTALALIRFEPRGDRISLEVGGLKVERVIHDGNTDVPFTVANGRLEVKVPPGDVEVIGVQYGFEVQPQEAFNGLLPNGSTVVWPYFCGNLFPCNSRPDDGMTFELNIGGQPEGQTVIAPKRITQEAPPYTLAWAVGEYVCQDLGTTEAGTTAQVCWLPRGKTKALAGTKDLVKVFDWLETNIGPYTFGDRVGSVSVNWGEAAAGGMEHHPLWHVTSQEMEDPLVHAHEAAHGWYGTGVRIACWEDFVLSEGTTSYLSARALGAISGKAVEDAIWAGYKQELLDTLEDEDVIAMPDGCNKVDLLEDGLFSNIVYMKGAFFYRALADAIGVERLDQVLSSFYLAHVSKAARMSEMLDHIKAETGFDPSALAKFWLRSRGNPFKK